MNLKDIRNVSFKLNKTLDKDIIEFIEKQTNSSLLFRTMIRNLIKEYGNKNLYIFLGNRGEDLKTKLK